MVDWWYKQHILILSARAKWLQFLLHGCNSYEDASNRAIETSLLLSSRKAQKRFKNSRQQVDKPRRQDTPRRVRSSKNGRIQNQWKLLRYTPNGKRRRRIGGIDSEPVQSSVLLDLWMVCKRPEGKTAKSGSGKWKWTNSFNSRCGNPARHPVHWRGGRRKKE